MSYIYYFLIINLLAFVLCGLDKWFSIKKYFRISEYILLFICFLGGCFAFLIGMYVFHHKTKSIRFKFLIPLIIILWLIIFGVYIYQLFFPKYYLASDFKINLITSDIDYNQNGIDDYTDILLGAKKEAKRHPKYKSSYYSGGYPPLDEGVCTDLVWRSIENAGYSLKDMIDLDIKENTYLYPRVENNPDPNIDFRRVKNLKVFFDRYLESYTLDIYDIKQWMPGDIVIFGENYTHIAIISDKRNKKGIPFIIHNAGQIKFEENTFERWYKNSKVVGHYRFSLKEVK